MRGWTTWVIGGVALTLFACFGAVAEVNDGDLQCTNGTRAFNGACRTICTSSSQCGSDDRCMSVDAEALCVPFQNCAYLASDTQCVGTGMYTIYTRGGQSTRPYSSTPPNANPLDVTNFDDPSFVPYPSPYGTSAGPEGCEGNARWVTAPAQGDPGCGTMHEVRRCRRSRGNSCILESGSTRDFLAP